MRLHGIFASGLMVMVLAALPASAADAPPPAANMAGPEVPPAAPGVFSSRKQGAKIHLAVTGHSFTSREAIEKYLAYRAAELTLAGHAQWFTFVEGRAKGDKVAAPKPDPAGLRYSFRMENWRPVWRYKTAASPAWITWSPFSAAAFFTGDPKSLTDYEVSADIVPHQGPMADDNPLAFDAGALSDLLVNQVSPPQ
jgi:hypothetical protein